MDNTSETNYSLNILNYKYHFDLLHKMDLQIYYAYYADRIIEQVDKDYGASLSFSNSYKDIDFYNSLIWNKNSLDIFDDTNYFDWTSTISWNISHNLSLTLKGENILDRAKGSSIIRINPQTGTFLNPLVVSPFDQRIILELEYRF